MERRALGNSGILVSPIAMGCWPIAGMTSEGVKDEDSLATLSACLDLGIDFLDTAYCYGMNGESERLIAQAVGHRRDELVIATKGGIHWKPRRMRVIDGTPATLKRECEESLRRLDTDRIDLLYLHAPDPQVPVSESAGALKELLDAGKTRSVGLSNANVAQLEEFASVCPLAAYQPHYNILQREIELDTLPWCREHNVAVIVYWPLMKGLLAGKLSRDHVFPSSDSRSRYAMFQGEEWQRNLDVVDCLREIADGLGKTVAQVAVNWTIHRAGITAALCGAKRPDQIRDNAGAAGWQLTAEDLAKIEDAVVARGEIVSQLAI